MHAAVIDRLGPPNVIEHRVVDNPVCGPDEVLVDMRAASVNPIDCYARAGLLPGQLPLPWIPGRDIAGVVRDVGASVTDFRIGDRVWATNQGFGGRMGTCAELCLVESKWLYPLPESVGFETAAALALVGVTAHLGLVQRIGLKPGERIFIRGVGGAVGSTVLQMAVALGASVYASAGGEQKVHRARAMGAIEVVNYQTDDVSARLKEMVPDGFDVAWDTTREPDLMQLVGAMAERGRIVLMAGRDATPPFPVGPFYVKQLSAYGIIMLKMTPEEMRWAAGDLNDWMAQKKVLPRIAARLPLSRTAEAHAMQEAATLRLDGSLSGKILIVPDSTI